MENAVTFILGIIVGGVVGALIGRNRKVGKGWSFLLGAILGILGWIIILFSKKKGTEFINMSGEEKL